MRKLIILVLSLWGSACVPGPDLSELPSCETGCEASGRVCEQGVCVIPSGVLVDPGQTDTGFCGDGLVRQYALRADGSSRPLDPSDPDFEACDDGNSINGDGCDEDCSLSACGNGILGGTDARPEECDDGNDNDNDDCRNNCLIARCGDGVVFEGEEVCDEGDSNSNSEPDRCRLNCNAARCGDGVVDSEESCDEGDANEDQGSCRSDCQQAECGDGYLRGDLNEGDDGYEACDDGDANDDLNPCRSDCRINVCGDGFVLTNSEECDDGDQDNTDACRNDCTPAECGDGVLRTDLEPSGERFEECDEGEDNADEASCLSSCRSNRCGDGFVLEGVEACDDANRQDDDSCLNSCDIARCGDGVRRADVDVDDIRYEACDDGNALDTDDCLTTCGTARCGDGAVWAGRELCDDGNQENDDACLDTCIPNVCNDGILRRGLAEGEEGFEACDDGNDSNLDGCTVLCRLAVCGDGFLRGGLQEDEEGFERCDDGNNVDEDACVGSCEPANCGDGITRLDLLPEDPDFEACDDGDGDNLDECRNNCQLPRCGDGILDEGEDCEPDVGNVESCTSACQEPGGDYIRFVRSRGFGQISDTISEDFTLTSDLFWLISGRVVVPAGVTLTIQPGTKLTAWIHQVSGTGRLVVEQGGRLVAAGTREAPIIFTTHGSPAARGQWGGILINGRAPANCADGQVSCPDAAPIERASGANTVYGGDQVDDNSGILRFVRIEYAGDCPGDCSSHWGLTLAGVGRGTVIDHVQVHGSSVGGLGVLGGTVNLKRVLITHTTERSLEWNFGWTGTAQYVILHSKGDELGGALGSNSPFAYNILPRSNPFLTNFSFVKESELSAAFVLRKGSDAQLYNSIMSGYDRCITLQDNTFDLGPDLVGNLFTCASAGLQLPGNQNIQAWLEDNENTVQLAPEQLPLMRPFGQSPDYRADPAFDLPLTVDLPDMAAEGIEVTNFVGAVAPNSAADWTLGWTLFDRIYRLEAHLTMETDRNQNGQLVDTQQHWLGNAIGDVQIVNGVIENGRLLGSENVGYIQLSEEFPTSGSNPRTVQFWVKTNDQREAGRDLFAFGRMAAGELFSGHLCGDGRVRFLGGAEAQNTECAGPVINDDRWHLLTFSYDGQGALKVFVDNEEVQAVEINPLQTAVWGSGAEAPRIGAGFQAPVGNNIRIDEFRYYQRVTDGAEVARVFQLERPEP